MKRGDDILPLQVNLLPVAHPKGVLRGWDISVGNPTFSQNLAPGPNVASASCSSLPNRRTSFSNLCMPRLDRGEL